MRQYDVNTFTSFGDSNSHALASSQVVFHLFARRFIVRCEYVIVRLSGVTRNFMRVRNSVFPITKLQI